MVETLSIGQARERLTRLPEQLAEAGNLHAVMVTRHGKPVLAVLPWELYESIVETLEVLSDREQMTALRESIAELARGETVAWERVKGELGS